MNVAVDTNLLLSGVATRGGPPGLMLTAWRKRRFTLISSTWRLEELRRVSRYPRVKKILKAHQIGALIGQMHNQAVVLEHLPKPEEG
jgi:predicted nucleic acid-binding protein